jgi:hypothetical protein
MTEETLRQWLDSVRGLGYNDPALVIGTDEEYLIRLSAEGMSDENGNYDSIEANTFAEIMVKFEAYHRERRWLK